MFEFSILIVDDDEVDRYTLKRLLKTGRVDAAVLEQFDGLSALEWFKDYQGNQQRLGGCFPPAVVLLDINMPRMNGFEFLEDFAQLCDEDDRYQDVAFIMLTSSSNSRDQEHAMEHSCVKGYVNKMPATAEELMVVIAPHLP